MSVNFFLSQVLNGHFVHYFAPKDLPVVPKNVVFVIDTSASMLGTKIRQVKRHHQWISMQSVSVSTCFSVQGFHSHIGERGFTLKDPIFSHVLAHLVKILFP